MKKLIALLITLTAFGLYGCGQVASSPDTTNTPSNPTTSSAAKTFSLTDISSHNTADNCWMAINGKVYDVTSFVNSHPGGAAMLQGCGIDATTLYDTKGENKPHSSRANAMLDNYYIGDLKQ